MDEFELWIAPARLGEQTFRCVKSFGWKAARIEPRHFAPAAAADVCGCATRNEETPDDVMQVRRRRLLVLVFCERRSILVIGRKRLAIQTLTLDFGEVRNGTRRGANFVEKPQAIFAHFRIVVIDLDL